MISLNLIVNHEDSSEIEAMSTPSFIIIYRSNSLFDHKKFFIIRTTEEEFTFLCIKFGKTNVWLR